MSKLREDYQFVYDTLSLRASMLVAPLVGGLVGGSGGSKSESTTSSSRDSAVSGDKTALGDKTVPVTTTDISTGTGAGTGDSVKVDVVGVSVGVNATAHDTVITSASSSEKVQSTYSTNIMSSTILFLLCLIFHFYLHENWEGGANFQSTKNGSSQT